MLSYRHAYHAGNHADVLKHAVLALILEGLKRKETPFCYLETHAGAGRYDLAAPQASQTGEYREGIGRIWGGSGGEEPPEALRPYLEAVAALNPQGGLRFYPGSPRIARHLLRPQDRMVLMELHSSDYPLLKQEFTAERRVAVHHMDGYQGLKAFLPPQERRGVVLIDPAYEVKGEYLQAAEALQGAHRRWPQGIFAIWYPLLAQPLSRALLRAVAESGLRKVLQVEFLPGTTEAGMVGSGLVIVNPPWQLDERLRAALPWLAHRLGGAAARWSVAWLVPE